MFATFAMQLKSIRSAPQPQLAIGRRAARRQLVRNIISLLDDAVE
jgi:hypothetical protein